MCTRRALSQNLFFQLRGNPGVIGYDRLHCLHLGLVKRILKALRKQLVSASSLEPAIAWQVAYLAYARYHCRFPGFRVFMSLESKRNFDDNLSFLVTLPLLVPKYLFERVAAKQPPVGQDRLEELGPTKLMMALVRFAQLTYPAQPAGFSEYQLDLLEQAAHECVVLSCCCAPSRTASPP